MGVLTRLRSVVDSGADLYECRHCGETFDTDRDECRSCRSTEIAHYEI
ncbi:hypothetical protein C495_01625 [Natronorubrum sulfidifaciens JCM 14089]|uniref:Small CPxCG-related zinc finger protein n=1 Tax=Natronorubrum sulfidifaciens JCM 14089 TaxID=1230460 RepID=L9WIG0_9EURY|nr:hypothetical protein C495_01625 [Natronorubrum sulfidifaciens JCM 14089]